MSGYNPHGTALPLVLFILCGCVLLPLYVATFLLAMPYAYVERLTRAYIQAGKDWNLR